MDHEKEISPWYGAENNLRLQFFNQGFSISIRCLGSQVQAP